MSAARRKPDLRRLQRWMSIVIQHPRHARVAIRSQQARALFPLGEVTSGAIVKPNDRMTPADRLHVYGGGYVARLIEVLAADYGGLQHLLGERAFELLCAAYVLKHPSRHPNLIRFGKELPSFLARRKLPHRAFAVELARLEVALSLSFDAAEFTPFDPAAHAGVPAERWERARLQLNPSVHLLAFRHPVNRWFQQFKDEQKPKVPRPARSWLCVFRKDGRVWRMNLTQPMYSVLSALRDGVPLGRALARARNTEGVGGWFQSWAADGLFSGVKFGR
jgi:hypothetical protein